MIRDHLFNKRVPTDRMFRWRGGEVSRLEGLSDGVFAVTLTLLIVSQSVPTTFYELFRVIRDLPVFLLCFTLLMLAWRYHYLFFRRFGLEDLLTNILNGAFLFLILFYAYPLKFLATFLWRLILREGTEPMFQVPPDVDWVNEAAQRAGVMYFFSFGIIGVFGILAAMTARAYRLREVLELDELERFLTQASIRSHLMTVGIASLSVSILLLGGQPGWAGVTYFLMWPAHMTDGILTAVRAERLSTRLAEQTPD